MPLGKRILNVKFRFLTEFSNFTDFPFHFKGLLSIFSLGVYVMLEILTYPYALDPWRHILFPIHKNSCKLPARKALSWINWQISLPSCPAWRPPLRKSPLNQNWPLSLLTADGDHISFAFPWSPSEGDFPRPLMSLHAGEHSASALQSLHSWDAADPCSSCWMGSSGSPSHRMGAGGPSRLSHLWRSHQRELFGPDPFWCLFCTGKVFPRGKPPRVPSWSPAI